MTFKDFMKGVAYLPANAFTGLVKLTLGSTEKVDRYDDQDQLIGQETVVKPGLLGLAVDGIKFVGRSISDFLYEHRKAIATAAWLSLAAAGAVALTLFLWPAALTAVASFSIYGLSIAGIAGANALAQIGLASLLTFTAVSAVTYVGAGIGNFVKWCASCCKNLKSKAPEGNPVLENEEEDDEEEQKGRDATIERVVKHQHSSSSEDEFHLHMEEEPKGNLYGHSELSRKGPKVVPTSSATIFEFPVDNHAHPLSSTKVEKKSEEDTLVVEPAASFEHK